jgi:hypothetical protein
MGPALCDSALTPIGNCPQKFTRKLAVGGAVALLLACGGCGGDDEKASTAPQTDTAPVATAATETQPRTEAERQPPKTEAETEAATETSPEDMPGGAGDAEPARTLALLTGRGGRITPRIVRVPAFIAVQIELRSKDGATYALRFGDTTLSTGGELNSVSTTIHGLRPNEVVVGRPVRGAGNRVRISATAEPGP